MRKVSLLSALLPLVLIACGEDSSTVQPPAPLTPDQQTVANCRAIQDALEAYAATHDGTYGEFSGTDFARYEYFENTYTGDQEPTHKPARNPGQIGLEWYACDGTLLGYRITSFGKDHTLITLENLSHVPPDVQNDHDVTMANALLVLDTAQQWAASNNGVYSTDVSGDENPDGKTLKDMLPNGDYLINPADDSNTNPQDGIGLGIDGAIGYMGSDSGTGHIDSYTIEAYGCWGDIIVTLSPYWEGEHRVRGQSNLLQDAVESFKQASGNYPHNLITEQTPDGKTVSDLYFANATHEFTRFVNPYTGDRTFAFIGTATNKGEVAYQPIETAGVVTDYVITARNTLFEIAHLGPTP